MRRFVLFFAIFVLLYPQPVRASYFTDVTLGMVTAAANVVAMGVEATLYMQDSDLNDIVESRLPIDDHPLCSTDMWEAMRNRAWEGAQREVTQAQNLLAKPDSVLKYSCFDSFLNNFAAVSHNDFPGDPDMSFSDSFLGLGDTIFDLARDLHNLALLGPIVPFAKNRLGSSVINLHMEYALEVLILSTLSDQYSLTNIPFIADFGNFAPFYAACVDPGRAKFYTQSNFGHRTLGNRGFMGQGITDISQSGFSCSMMSAVWDEARCYDFGTEGGHDGFFSFSDTAPGGAIKTSSYSASDKRTQPRSCPSSRIDYTDYLLDYATSLLPATTRLALLSQHGCNMYSHGEMPLDAGELWLFPAVSSPGPSSWAAHAGANPAPGTGGGNDPYVTYNNILDPSVCTSYTPLKTGVTITLVDGTTYDDAYCLAPGCWYNPAVSTTQCQPF